MLARSGLRSDSWGERGEILQADKFPNVGSGGGEMPKLPQDAGLAPVITNPDFCLLKDNVITICFMKQVVWHFIPVTQHR